MEMDEDDDIYVPEEPQEDSQQAQPPIATRAAEELEEGEEEDESGAMDEDDDDSVSQCTLLALRHIYLIRLAGYRHHYRTKRRHYSCAPKVGPAIPSCYGANITATEC